MVHRLRPFAGLFVMLCVAFTAAGASPVHAWPHGDEAQPLYETIFSDGDYELRRYRRLLLASVTLEGSRRGTMGRALDILRAYTARGNCPVRHPIPPQPLGVGSCTCDALDGTGRPLCVGDVIDVHTAWRKQPSRDWQRDGPARRMAVPVLQSLERAGTWRVSFILPDEYVRSTAPRPHDPRIVLHEWPATTRVAQSFSAVPQAGTIGRKTAGLLGFAAYHGVEPVGGPTFAIYNPPFALFPLRRNEVLIDVRRPGF